MYLKIKDFKDYDDYYYELEDIDSAWKEVLSYTECALDNEYIENKKMIGIKLHIEIVASIPKDID